MTLVELIEILKTMPYGSMISNHDGHPLRFVRQHHEDKMNVNLIFQDYRYIDHIKKDAEQ